MTGAPGFNTAQALQVRTMDSREIADLTGKDHAHVCRDIRAMLLDLGVDQSRFGSVYTGGNGEARSCYALPYRETMILVSGYSVELRARVVDRWIELERSGAPLPDFTNPAIAARAWAEQYERVQELKPLAAAAERIAGARGLRTITAVGKINGIGPRRIFEVLEVRGLIFRRNGAWLPYQEWIEAGYFIVRERTYQDDYGDEHLHLQTYVTGKGETWLAKRLFAEGKAS